MARARAVSGSALPAGSRPISSRSAHATTLPRSPGQTSPGYATAQATAYVVKSVLENQLGAEVKIVEAGFAEFFDLQTTDEAVATADLDAASKSGGAWVGYFYGPHQNFSRYELVRLEEPAHDDTTWTFVQPSDPNWLANSSIKSAYKDAAIHLAYANSLATAHPDVAGILNKVQFTTDQVSALAYAIAVEGKTPQQAADEWVKANAELVAGWTAP